MPETIFRMTEEFSFWKHTDLQKKKKFTMDHNQWTQASVLSSHFKKRERENEKRYEDKSIFK